jgi:hypothetical protein
VIDISRSTPHHSLFFKLQFNGKRIIKFKAS